VRTIGLSKASNLPICTGTFLTARCGVFHALSQIGQDSCGNSNGFQSDGFRSSNPTTPASQSVSVGRSRFVRPVACERGCVLDRLGGRKRIPQHEHAYCCLCARGQERSQAGRESLVIESGRPTSAPGTNPAHSRRAEHVRDAALGDMSAKRVGALVILDDPVLVTSAERLARLALRHRLPSSGFTELGTVERTKAWMQASGRRQRSWTASGAMAKATVRVA
jgi:hypothetical protein